MKRAKNFKTSVNTASSPSVGRSVDGGEKFPARIQSWQGSQNQGCNSIDIYDLGLGLGQGLGTILGGLRTILGVAIQTCLNTPKHD